MLEMMRASAQMRNGFYTLGYLPLYDAIAKIQIHDHDVFLR